MKITVIGMGYVGLVTGTCLAELGNSTFCLDVDLASRHSSIATALLVDCSSLQMLRPVWRLAISSSLTRPRYLTKTAMLISIRFRCNAQHRPSHERLKVVVDKSTVPMVTGVKVQVALAQTLAGRGAATAGVSFPVWPTSSSSRKVRRFKTSCSTTASLSWRRQHSDLLAGPRAYGLPLLRNLYESREMVEAGFEYEGVGRQAGEMPA